MQGMDSGVVALNEFVTADGKEIMERKLLLRECEADFGRSV